MRLKVNEVDVRELVAAAQSYVVPQAAKKGIKLSHVVDQDVTHFRGDRDKLRQCLINLMSNAVKFTPQQGRIDVHARNFVGPRRQAEGGRFGVPEERFLRIDVADSGIGIPADKLEKVFLSFYQVDNSITREYGGTGLGLAIVKRFVEAHHGEIWLESKEGQGTTFSLLLPVDGVAETEVASTFRF